jgi:DNA-binding beta-propeller fold protein YncE
MGVKHWKLPSDDGTKDFVKNYNGSARGRSAERVSVGEIVGKNFWRKCKLAGLCLAAASLLWMNGCSSSSANVITVTLSQTSATVIVSQSLTLTATVNGATNLNVTWKCTYTTTPTAANSKTSAAAACTSDTGNIPANSTAVTVTFTAPNTVPDPTTFPNLQITITATSVQNTGKTGTCVITLDSGIAVGIGPQTATVPVKEQQQFAFQLTNDLQSKGVTWLVTQSVPTTTGTTTTTFPQLPTCTVSGNATGCGSIDANGLYTAPAVVPTSTTVTSTPANVTVVATSVADPTRFALGTITIIAGGPITFSGISPTIAPQGGILWDIYLNAPNISSATSITLTGTKGGPPTVLTSISSQVKVLFPIPNTTVTNPASTGARIRLNAANLANADTYTVSVNDPVETVTTSPTGSYSFTVLPVRPTSIASVPDDVVQGTLSNEIKLSVDGGYFGPNGQIANLLFAGNSVPGDSTTVSGPRQFNAAFPSAGINSGIPGLYQLAVARTTAPLPVPNNPAVTDLAVFPNYSVNPPSVPQNFTAIPAGTNPSAIDIDPILGVAVVAETGSNAIQFYTIGTGTLTPLGVPITSATTPGVTINAPTGVSVNRANHTVAVINYGDQTVSVLPIPGAPQQAPGTPFNVSLANGISALNTTNTPYAIGVDPDTNLALVAYSNPSTTNLANVGFIVNLNPGNPPPFGCINDTAMTLNPGPCVFAQVTLNTGTYPQIAMAPHGHLAFVTPGGSGAVQGIDVTKHSSSVGITTLSLVSGIVTVTTSSAHNLNPGNPGTVLISGVKSANSNSTTNEFNGAFAVNAVLSSTQFTYSVTSTTNDTGTGGAVFFSSPNLTFGISQTSQGIAVNPITRVAAIADANATGSNGPQINLLNALDQNVTSIFFNADCTFYVTAPTPCLSSPELLGTTNVAWQPYSNALVSYNPQQNQVSVSDPVSLKRYAFACQSPGACQVNPIIPSQVTLTGSGAATVTVQLSGGGSSSLKLFGGLAVDPATNQAFVVMSGSGTIDVINLGPNPPAPLLTNLKPAEITELVVPSKTPGPGIIGGIPNAILPQGALTCIPVPPAPASSCDLAGVQIYGSGFAAGAQVRLDGTSIPSADVQLVSSRQLTVTIPASFLAFPHKYAVDVISNSSQSNATDFMVLQAIDVSQICPGVTNPQPSSVAIADQLANGPFSPIAVVSLSGCNSITVIDINPASATFGAVKNTIAVGTTPMGVAISQHLGMAVIANNGSNSVSVVNLLTGVEAVPDITSSQGIGTNPTGVAINDSTAAAIVTNTGSNTVTEIDLSPLFGTTPPTSLTGISIAVDQSPIAVAIDPDRGTNNMGLAVVTALELQSGAAPQGALDSVDIGAATPIKSITGTVGSITAAPTDVVYDPTVVPALFYANSSGGNVIASFDPDTGAAPITSVGINPTSLALNLQTGAILTSNSVSNTISIVDTISNPFRTRQTLGIPGSPQFGVAIDQFTNLAVIVDQANNRVFLLQMPN